MNDFESFGLGSLPGSPAKLKGTKMEKYEDRFCDWEDIQHEFRMDEPKPDEVIYASYTYENYSGSAIVIYRRGEKFYVNQGGHCSCNGLEGQWDPTEYESLELFRACVVKGYWYNKEEILATIPDILAMG